MAKNFSNVAKIINTEIEKPEKKQNPNNFMSRHNIIKLLKTKHNIKTICKLEVSLWVNKSNMLLLKVK